MPSADWPTDLLPPVPASPAEPRPPLRERVRSAFEIVAWACTIVALLAFDAILILFCVAVWRAR
jgi:hypothetical protein